MIPSIGVRWCSFCTKRKATGTLTLQDNETKELFDLPACQDCVDNEKWR